MSALERVAGRRRTRTSCIRFPRQGITDHRTKPRSRTGLCASLQPPSRIPTGATHATGPMLEPQSGERCRGCLHWLARDFVTARYRLHRRPKHTSRYRLSRADSRVLHGPYPALRIYGFRSTDCYSRIGRQHHSGLGYGSHTQRVRSPILSLSRHFKTQPSSVRPHAVREASPEGILLDALRVSFYCQPRHSRPGCSGRPFGHVVDVRCPCRLFCLPAPWSLWWCAFPLPPGGHQARFRVRLRLTLWCRLVAGRLSSSRPASAPVPGAAGRVGWCAFRWVACCLKATNRSSRKLP